MSSLEKEGGTLFLREMTLYYTRYKQKKIEREFSLFEVWGWAILSAFILTVALSLAELASAAPTSGGLFTFGHALASLTGWTKFRFQQVCKYRNKKPILLASSIDWAYAIQVMAVATIRVKRREFCTNDRTDIWLAVAWAETYIMLRIVFLVVLPNYTPKGSMNNASFALGKLHKPTNAATTVPWATIGAVALGCILGTAINIVLAFCAGRDMATILDSKIGHPMVRAGTHSLCSVIVIAQYMMGSNMLLAASRQTFAFSRDGALPLSRYMCSINRYMKTPGNSDIIFIRKAFLILAVWFVAVLAPCMGLLSFSGPSAKNALFAVSIIGNNITYTILIVARFIYSRHTFQRGPYSRDMAVVVMYGASVFSLAWYYIPKYRGIHWFNWTHDYWGWHYGKSSRLVKPT
ncbi:hypothetical protein BU17DRAFT_62881 [Hysterangium stoloniferum]|nr:hypothetical protein BU17DRAFT_62881 [Hysterangium stoloniferum]